MRLFPVYQFKTAFNHDTIAIQGATLLTKMIQGTIFSLDRSHLLYFPYFLFATLALYLFIRYVYWGLKARLVYWKKADYLSLTRLTTDSKESRLLPYFSIMVPARDEADVIANTIGHLASLNYPGDRYEIVVITDAKELRVKENNPSKITTQEIVEEKRAEYAAVSGKPSVKHAVVPYDFDGRLNGRCLGKEMPSTKARALNFGLRFVCQETDIISFFDAESRPEKDLLLYLASRYLSTEGKQKLWQGPVFQVRNFYQLGPLNKIIALYQALAHDWYLPILMQYLPFLGGTNLHVEKNLLLKIGGYDHSALSEDLELGIRAYLETGEWPEYLPMVSTEQTPAKYQAYYRQRLRWGSGHLQVFDKLKTATKYPAQLSLPLLKTLFWKGHAQWYLYQTMTIAPFTFLVLTWQGVMDPANIPGEIRSLLSWLLPVFYGFTFYLYYRYRHYIDYSVAPGGLLKYLAVIQIAIFPIAGLLIALPFTSALLLRAIHRQPNTWVKTPRTNEARSKAT